MKHLWNKEIYYFEIRIWKEKFSIRESDVFYMYVIVLIKVIYAYSKFGLDTVIQGNKSIVTSNIGVFVGIYKCFVEINACALENA